jgi:hypothetical protein
MITRIGGWLGRHWILATVTVALAIALAASGRDAGFTLLWAALIAFYWLPAIVAWSRHVPNAGSVTVVNFFAWFLFFPWIIALAMACRSRPAAPALFPGTPQSSGGWTSGSSR